MVEPWGGLHVTCAVVLSLCLCSVTAFISPAGNGIMHQLGVVSRQPIIITKVTKNLRHDQQQQQQQQRCCGVSRQLGMQVDLFKKGGDKKVNVVLTHTTADFDSLAAAVGLARVWQAEMPETPCFVCLPRGAHPTVHHFLALHKSLYPVKKLKELKNEQLEVERLGLVDAQRRDRVGPAAYLVEEAKEVHIFDHHMEKNSDINATNFVIEKVGSVTTIITEMLDQNGLELRDAEATLLALGIHSDTGSLTYDGATSRDARALAWLMEQGASQQAIAEYGHASLSPEQQECLTEAFLQVNRTVHNGITIATVLMETDGYVNGMARVAQNILDVTNSDIFILGTVFAQRKGKEPTHMCLIGRAKSWVRPPLDLNKVMERYGGGGHVKASAATFRLDDPMIAMMQKDNDRVKRGDKEGGQDKMEKENEHESQISQEQQMEETEEEHDNKDSNEEHEQEQLVNEIAEAQGVMDDAIDQIKNMIVRQNTAGDIMTAPVLSCTPDDLIDSVAASLERVEIRGMPVVFNKTDDTVVGMISYREVKKALEADKGQTAVKGWMMHLKPNHRIRGDLALDQVEQLLVESDVGRLPVVDDQGKLVGLITRTDLLRQHHYYNSLHYHNKAFSQQIDSPHRKWLMALRRNLKQFDPD